MQIRGPILNPRPNGKVDFIPDGLLASNADGEITFIGPYNGSPNFEQSRGIICPPFFDNHIHIPQHPIRGRFMEGVEPHPPHGRLIAGLNRNVFPAESLCSDPQYTRQTVQDFLDDTLAHGVIGGAAYMTVHPGAAQIALDLLPGTWCVGPVLMNMNCPDYLRTDELNWHREFEQLAKDYGRRVIVTDRFAVAVSTDLRRKAVHLAKQHGLRMQTHLNEQIMEKAFIERTLYPDAGTYTNVYLKDGLLDCQPILAHCVRMSPAEFDVVASKAGACIAHCPTSNTLLGSGIMPLDLVKQRGIDFAICTDVGASPTTSILCEMSQYLKVHENASAEEAFYRCTLAPARMLGFDLGTFEPGKAMNFIEIDCDMKNLSQRSAAQIIESKLLELERHDFSAPLHLLRDKGLDTSPELSLLEEDVNQTVRKLDKKVLKVVVDGEIVWQRTR